MKQGRFDLGGGKLMDVNGGKGMVSYKETKRKGVNPVGLLKNWSKIKK